MESIGTGSGGYCVTLVYPIPLLPSGPGGVFRLQLHSPPKPVRLSGAPLERREWDSNPRWSYPHTRFPSVLLKPLGHLSNELFDCITTRNLYAPNEGNTDCPGRGATEYRSQILYEFPVVNLAKPRGILLEL